AEHRTEGSLRPSDDHDAEGLPHDGPEPLLDVRRREGSEQLELAATEQGSNLRNRIGLNRVDLREPIEEPLPAADEESEFNGRSTGLRVVSRFFESVDFYSISGGLEPGWAWAGSGRGGWGSRD